MPVIANHPNPQRLGWQNEYNEEEDRNIGYVGQVWASHAEVSKLFGRHKQPNGKYVIPLEGTNKQTTAGIKQNVLTGKYKPNPIVIGYEVELVPSVVVGKCKFNDSILWNTVSQLKDAADKIQKRVNQSRYKTKFQTSYR